MPVCRAIGYLRRNAIGEVWGPQPTPALALRASSRSVGTSSCARGWPTGPPGSADPLDVAGIERRHAHANTAPNVAMSIRRSTCRSLLASIFVGRRPRGQGSRGGEAARQLVRNVLRLPAARALEPVAARVDEDSV